MYKYAIIIYAIWNIVVFAMFGIDKHKAQRGKWRISERVLMVSAAFMGALGALFGMRVFRHKTHHKKFTIGVPLLLIVNLAVIAGAVYFVLR